MPPPAESFPRASDQAVLPGFFDRRDLFLALGTEVIICSPALAVAWWLHADRAASLFSCLLGFWLVQMAVAIAVLKVLRSAFPMLPGRYSYSPRARTTYVWTLNSFICATNLGLLYNHPSLMPSPVKKVFYQLLGAKLGAGPMMLGGRLTDPHLITVEAGVVVGGDCWLLAHAMVRFETNLLILAPIVIQRDAIIGAYSLVMPGVTVRPGAMLRAMSYVPLGTTIPAGDSWGGNPAVRRLPPAPRK